MHEARSHLSQVVAKSLYGVSHAADIPGTIIKQVHIVCSATARTADSCDAMGSAIRVQRTSLDSKTRYTDDRLSR